MSERRRKFISTPPVESWSRSGQLWGCPVCGKLYPRAGQGHACIVVPLEHHFRDRPRARELFDAFYLALEQIDESVRLSVAKTRIGFITNLTFAAVMPRKVCLRAQILLRRRVDSPRFLRVDEGPPYWVHHFEIRHTDDLDGELRSWLREACRVGKR